MGTCKHQEQVERWLDGECTDTNGVEKHLTACPSCRSYAEQAKRMREGVRAVSEQATIDDAQFPAFYEAIREGVNHPSRRPARWAILSITTAAIIVAISIVSIAFNFSGDPMQPVRAEVEQVSTEIDGATATFNYDDDGTATVWVNVPEGKEI